MIEYPRFHQSRTNLAIHVLAVPLFELGTVATILALIRGDWFSAAMFAVVPPIAFAVQGIGHSREPNPPIPFAGPGDFVYRVLAEQFYRFPRFVLTGGFARAWRGAPS